MVKKILFTKKSHIQISKNNAPCCILLHLTQKMFFFYHVGKCIKIEYELAYFIFSSNNGFENSI